MLDIELIIIIKKANIISDCIRKTSIVSINQKYRENNNKNNDKNNDKNITVRERVYSKYGIYNCERRATTIHPRH